MHWTRVVGCHVVAIVAPGVAAALRGGTCTTKQCRRQARGGSARSFQFSRESAEPTGQQQQLVDLMRRDLRGLMLDGRKDLIDQLLQARLVDGRSGHLRLRAYAATTNQV